MIGTNDAAPHDPRMPDDLKDRAEQVVAGAINLNHPATQSPASVIVEHLEANGFLVEPMELTILNRRLVEARRYVQAMAVTTDNSVEAACWSDLLTILGES